VKSHQDVPAAPQSEGEWRVVLNSWADEAAKEALNLWPRCAQDEVRQEDACEEARRGLANLGRVLACGPAPKVEWAHLPPRASPPSAVRPCFLQHVLHEVAVSRWRCVQCLHGFQS